LVLVLNTRYHIVQTHHYKFPICFILRSVLWAPQRTRISFRDGVGRRQFSLNDFHLFVLVVSSLAALFGGSAAPKEKADLYTGGILGLFSGCSRGVLEVQGLSPIISLAPLHQEQPPSAIVIKCHWLPSRPRVLCAVVGAVNQLK